MSREIVRPHTFGEIQALSAALAASKLFGVQSPEQALAIVLTGQDLGLSAAQSLRAIYVVQGKPVVSADALVAAVLSSGHCAYWVTRESTPERCTVETQRKGSPAPESVTWTREDADRAKLTSKDIWKSYPADMLRHRACAVLARRVYPDVVLGIYAPAELPEDDRAVEVIAQTAAPRPIAAPPLDPPVALPEGPEPQLSPVQEVIHTLRYHLGDSGITPLVAAAAWVEHEGVLSADDLAELFEELHKCLPAGISKATLQHSIVIERLAAKCLKIESLEDLEYLIIGQYAQRQSLPLKVRPLWDKELAKHAERLGCKTPIEWVRAICDHDEPTPPPGKPQPTPPPAPTTVAGTATETERASLDGLRVSLATKSKSGDPAYAIGCAFAKRRSVLGRHLAEGRALTIDALLPHCAGDEAQANARLDGICREWDSKQGRRAA
jgi:hypothetical protein